MTQQYDNDNTGILSKNDRKTEDWHPEYRGIATIGGEDYYIDATIRERKDGSGKFFSLKFKPKTDKPAGKPQVKSAQKHEDESDIPFATSADCLDVMFINRKAQRTKAAR